VRTFDLKFDEFKLQYFHGIVLSDRINSCIYNFWYIVSPRRRFEAHFIPRSSANTCQQLRSLERQLFSQDLPGILVESAHRR
jgi:hypothetical protein